MLGLTAILFFYPVLASTVLSVFACYPVLGRSYWVHQMEQACYQSQHLALLLSVGVLGLLFCVALPPVWLFYALYTRRNALKAATN